MLKKVEMRQVKYVRHSQRQNILITTIHGGEIEETAARGGSDTSGEITSD